MSTLTPFSSFVQIHKSYIVNLAYYKEVEKAVVVLKNGEKIRITKTFKENFYKGLSEYIRGV
jgi:DNA-binding LytR/AlgR family response regulator